MTRGQGRSLMRRAHSGVGWVVAGLLLVVSGSGIVLQHPDWLGSEKYGPLCVAADPADGRRVLRGTHWGVEVSSDGGAHWREAVMLAPPTDVVRILFVPRRDEDSVVYAMGSDGLVVSRDGGRIWQAVALPRGLPVDGAELLDLTVGPDDRVLLLTSAGLMRREIGDQWTRVGEPVVEGRDWRRWVHNLHTGHLAGSAGRRLAEAGAWGLVLLVLTGLVLQRRVLRRGRT